MHIDPNAHKSGKVTVSYDPSVIRKPIRKRNSLSEKEYLRETQDLLGGNRNYDQGYRSTNSKLKRQKQFKKGFNTGKFVSISAASNYTGLSYATCKMYAKELHLSLYDNRSNRWLQGEKPDYAK